MTFQIVSWNVNSINARLPNIVSLIEMKQPDILLLQEIKTTHENFPQEILSDLGYNLAIYGQKSYNGVAILSKSPIEDVIKKDFGTGQARYIEGAVCLGDSYARIASLYVPNGQSVSSPKFQEKLAFLEELKTYLSTVKQSDEIFILGGDLNVAYLTIDVLNPIAMKGMVCFTNEERDLIHYILELGFIDGWREQNPGKVGFTWWDYRHNSFKSNIGMKLDTILLSELAYKSLGSSEIYSQARGWLRPSDHAPVIYDIL